MALSPMAIVPPRLDPFGKKAEPSPTFPTAAPMERPPVEVPEDYDVSRRMRELYTPEMESQELFNQILNQYPQRQPPSLIREIGSSLAGLGPGGYDTAVKAREEPFTNALEDWKNRMEPAQQAMINERLANVNLRTLANQIVSQELADKRLERAVSRDKVLEQQGASRIAQGAERLRLQAARDRGGEIKLDPSTGRWKIVFKDGSEIPTSLHQLPEQERLELIQEFALERIRTAGEVREETRPSRTKTEVIDDPDNPGRKILVTIDQDTGKVTPASYERPVKAPTKVTPVLREGELEKSREINARALRVKNSNERWSKWVEFNKSGEFVRIKPSSWFGLVGPKPEEFRAIFHAIFGRAPTTEESKPVDTPTNAARPQQTAAPKPPTPGQIRVRRKDTGATGWWDPKKGPIPSLLEEVK